MDNIDFEKIVQQLSSIKDKEGNNLNMNSVAISTHTHTFIHHFKEESSLQNLRSVCKCIVSICVGIAIDEKLKVNKEPLHLDTLVWPVLKDKVQLKNKKNIKHLEKITLRHLLTHTMGYEDKLLKSKDIKDIDPFTYLEMIINHDIKNSPGDYFLYSNAAPYILSAFMQTILGRNLSDFAKQKIFDKLSIRNYEWKNYGNYCAGGTGLKMHIGDLIKIGRLFLENGVYDSNRIVSKEWISQMTSPQILTPSMYDSSRVFPKYAYGFLMWICENGIFYCDGTDGQYLIMIPNKNLAIATIATQPDMKPITQCFRSILE